jgi:hypothetical protein
MPESKNELLSLDRDRAQMLYNLLRQAQAPGPSARTLADLHDEVKEIAKLMGIPVQ